MPTLPDIIRTGRRVEAHRPWPRIIVDEAGWREIAAALGDGGFTLGGLWGEAAAVHMALWDEEAAAIVVSLDCPNGVFPSVGHAHAPAIRLERAIHDLFGLKPDGAPDEQSHRSA